MKCLNINWNMNILAKVKYIMFNIILFLDPENKTNFYDAPVDAQQLLIKKRVKLYSQKTYKKVHESKVKKIIKIY